MADEKSPLLLGDPDSGSINNGDVSGKPQTFTRSLSLISGIAFIVGYVWYGMVWYGMVLSTTRNILALS